MIRELTVRELFAERYAPLRLAEKAEATRAEYRVALNHLRRYVGRDPTVSELCNDLIEGLLADLIAKGRSPATANKTRAHLLALWRFAHKRLLVADPPDVERLKVFQRVPVAWFDWEVSKILAAAAHERWDICGIPAHRWWNALFLTLFDTGLRINAVMHAQWENFQEAQRMIGIPPEHQKQGVGQMPDLSDQAMKALAAIRRPSGLIFPWPYDQNNRQWATLNRHLRRILTRAGLPTTRLDLFHKWRKTTASYIQRAGGDATSRLGHSGRQVTRCYLDPRIATPPRQVDLLPRPIVPSDDPQLTLF